MNRNLEARIKQLEKRIKPITVIYFREPGETFEQRKQRYREEKGRELPENTIVICYRRIDIKKKVIPETS